MNIAFLRNSISSKTLLFLAAFSFVLVGIFGTLQDAKASNTLSVVYDTQKATYYSDVIKSADRLITLQDTNGSWDWVVTGLTASTGENNYNLAGVTALVFLDAYDLTGDQKYVDAAKKAGDYLVDFNSPSVSIAKSQNADSIRFLNRLTTVTGITSYSATASAIYNSVFHELNYEATHDGNHCDASGCTPAQLRAAYDEYYGATYQGAAVWNLEPFVIVAKDAGDTSTAEALEGEMLAEIATYTPATPYYALAIVSGISAANTIGDAPGKASLLGLLTANSDGSFGTETEGKVQTTAYALMALKMVGDSRADAAASYLGTEFGYSTFDGWKDTGATPADYAEYAEVDAEAARALFSYFHQSNTFYTIQDAVNAAGSGNTINVGAGEYTENVTIPTSLSLQGVAGANLTGSITIASDNVTVDGMNITNPSGNFGIVATDHSNLIITHNTIHGIGTSLTEGSAQAIAVISNVADVSTINIENNTISNIGITSMVHAGSAGSSAKGVYLGNSTGSNIISNVIISRNTINNIYASTADWIGFAGGYHGGAGAYGLLVNHKTTSLQVTNNTIGTLEGLWAHAIGLEKDTSNAVVTGNTITGLTDHKGGADKVAVFFESNPSGNTVTVNYNSFDDTFYGVAIHPDDVVAYDYTVDAMHNWWGSADPEVISTLISGTVDTSNPITNPNPVITLNGSPELAIYVGSSYTDEGATAMDPVEGTLTSSIVTNNIVNTEDPGDYTVTYDVTNAAGLTATQVVRTIHVFPLEVQQLILGEDTSMDTSHTEVVVGDNSNDSTITIPETVTEPTINFAALLETSGDNKTVTTTAELTIDATTGSSGSVNVTLPSGLVITGGSTWDGIINAPTNKLTEFILPGGNLSSAIEVGLTGQSLTFNKAVRLLFAGKAGKRAGYDPGSGFHEITTECTADNQVAVDAQLSGNSECKFDDGVDLVIWTKHFTTFAAYTRQISSGGGGGGSYVPPTVSVPVAVNPPVVTPTVPQGQVLGETIINSHPEGTFISIGKAIYIVSAGKKRPFATFSEFQSYGKVSVVKASEADQLLPDGDIIRAKSGTIATDLKDRKTIYLLNEKGEKQGFATYTAFIKMKYKLSQVKRLDLSVYPTGEVIN